MFKWIEAARDRASKELSVGAKNWQEPQDRFIVK
jgi:hypothetical protein